MNEEQNVALLSARCNLEGLLAQTSLLEDIIGSLPSSDEAIIKAGGLREFLKHIHIVLDAKCSESKEEYTQLLNQMENEQK